jgi:hypothetical protein
MTAYWHKGTHPVSDVVILDPVERKTAHKHGSDGQRCVDLMASEFVTLDSGERVDFPSGMRRDTDAGKPRYDLIPRPMLKRLAELYARGAEKYGDSNWTLADSQAEVDRFKASAFRHFMQWLEGDVDEDHASAVTFNVFAAETIAAKLEADR